jgi:hypothetical protein
LPTKGDQFCVTERDVWGHGLIPSTGYLGAPQPVALPIVGQRRPRRRHAAISIGSSLGAFGQ